MGRPEATRDRSERGTSETRTGAQGEPNERGAAEEYQSQRPAPPPTDELGYCQPNPQGGPFVQPITRSQANKSGNIGFYVKEWSEAGAASGGERERSECSDLAGKARQEQGVAIREERERRAAGAVLAGVLGYVQLRVRLGALFAPVGALHLCRPRCVPMTGAESTSRSRTSAAGSRSAAVERNERREREPER